MKKTLQVVPNEAFASTNRQSAPKVPLESGSSSATGSPSVAAKGLTSPIRKTRLRAEVTTICLVRKSQAGLSS